MDRDEGNDTESSDFAKAVRGAEHRACKKLESRLSDGVAWAVFKRLLRKPILLLNRLIFFSIIWKLETVSGIVLDFISSGSRLPPLEGEARGEGMLRVATDIHKMILLVWNLCLYTLCWSVQSSVDGPIKYWILGVGALWSAVRLVQMFTMIIAISFDPHFSCADYARPAFNTLGHYLEIAGLFAIAYLVMACFDPTAFNFVDGQSAVLRHPANAYYFSHMTIATVSFGDIIPAKVLPRVAVGCEILIGLFILIVILQRAFSAAGQAIPQGIVHAPSSTDKTPY